MPIVEIIHDILESRGYRVLATSDSERALALLEEDPGPIDVLLTDVQMPDRSGPELASRVQQRWPDVTVIFMSGHSRESLPEGALPPDARVLVKPITLEALLLAVGTALGGLTSASSRARSRFRNSTSRLSPQRGCPLLEPLRMVERGEDLLVPKSLAIGPALTAGRRPALRSTPTASSRAARRLALAGW